jgi:HK97 family phage major capsid protein
MANQIPLSGATSAAGGYILPTEQGDILTNGLLQESEALALAGDRRATGARKERFPIWLGTPTAGFVAEGANKPITGAELSETYINIKKIATIIPFTDEMREDVASGDLDVLVDTGVRSAIADVVDANIVGKDSGTNITTNFDNALRATTSTVELGTSPDALRLAVSAAMGTLEANGYRQNLGVLLAPDVARHIRDARAAF